MQILQVNMSLRCHWYDFSPVRHTIQSTDLETAEPNVQRQTHCNAQCTTLGISTAAAAPSPTLWCNQTAPGGSSQTQAGQTRPSECGLKRKKGFQPPSKYARKENAKAKVTGMNSLLRINTEERSRHTSTFLSSHTRAYTQIYTTIQMFGVIDFMLLL